MALAVYNAQANTVKTFVRDDHGGYVPPEGYALVAPNELPEGWTLEVDTSHAEWLALLRERAKRFLGRQEATEAVIRAVVLLTLDEINDLRQWVTAFKAQTALATNLGNFQTRVAGLPNMPDRTAQQARTAIENKIDAGDADE